ncbi:MAG TPA: amino acid ABC transporter permease [Candidatus Binatia bacterium]|nr:amino acid ABC transporter permease [Candidatus Binatia bacterium]
MHPSRPRWPWHLVTAAVIAALGTGLYFSSRRVDYDWHWERIPDYVLSRGGERVVAPVDGVAHPDADGRGITIEARTDPPQRARIEQVTRALVGEGDLVFAGDPVAMREGWTAGPLLLGLAVTLQLSALALVFALLLGLLAGLGRVSANPSAFALSTAYVEVVRGTPLLVQIFIFYFFIGTVLRLSAFTAGVAALAVFTGAYVAEIVRAGIEAVPRGQMEAARSLGMGTLQAMRHVVLPQALRKTLPPLAGQSINLVKDSSLVSVIAITDLSKAGREVVASTFSAFEVWFSVAAMYLVLTGALSVLVRRVERRLAASD